MMTGYDKIALRMLKEDLTILSDLLAVGSPAKAYLGCAMGHVQSIERELEIGERRDQA